MGVGRKVFSAAAGAPLLPVGYRPMAESRRGWTEAARIWDDVNPQGQEAPPGGPPSLVVRAFVLLRLGFDVVVEAALDRAHR